jgi:F-type H+-transporting ATPase subunit a
LKMVGLKEDHRPWDNAMVMELLVVFLMVLLFSFLRPRLSVDKPGKLQHLVEVVYQFPKKTADEMGIHHSEKYMPMFATMFLLILFANLIGLIPGLESPTMGYIMPLGCAVVVFAYYNYLGFKMQGVVTYIKHFMGPVWWLAWLVFPIEIVSHFVRPMSLTIRLYANMFAGEQITIAFMDLTKIVIPVIFLGLHVFVSLLQAYIFTLLTMIYVSGSAVEHHEEHH